MYFPAPGSLTSIEAVRDLKPNQIQLKFSMKWKLETSDGVQKIVPECLSLKITFF